VKKLRTIKKHALEIKNLIRLKHILYLLILPIISGSLMLLPTTFRDSIKLSYNNISLLSLLSSSFIHASWQHYLGNMSLFMIVTIFQLILISYIYKAKDYFQLLLLTIITTPIIISIVQILFYPIISFSLETSCGASGIVSAVVGFVPALLIYYVSNKIKKNLFDGNLFIIIISYIALSFSFSYFTYHKSIIILLVPFLPMIYYSYRYKENIISIIRYFISYRMGNMFVNHSLLVLLLIFVTMAQFIFPVKLMIQDGIIDFFAHYIGVLYGFNIGYIYFKNKLNPNRSK